MGKHSLVKVGVLFVVSVLALTAFVQTANAALTLENARFWYWIDDTDVWSVAVGDLDFDGKAEIVTGGEYWDGARTTAQLCVWDGATTALENVKTWQWGNVTRISSVAVGDVDGDGRPEIVTAGYYFDGTRNVAQLCVWNPKLALENVRVWYWTSDTYGGSVAVGDVDGDGDMEIVTGGSYEDGTRRNAQLCVWNGDTLALENVRVWHWTSDTYIYSVAVGDVDVDGDMEIVTGGNFHDEYGTPSAQLCVWDGTTLAIENVQAWQWGAHDYLFSVAVGNVDHTEDKPEIVTAGYYWADFTVHFGFYAHLCVWNGATLALENCQTWQTIDWTFLSSVAVGDVDGDTWPEVVTGGSYEDGTRRNAQLCVWNGDTLALENVQSWYWADDTRINSVAVGDVDGDAKVEIVTGGSYWNDTLGWAQLCVWA